MSYSVVTLELGGCWGFVHNPAILYIALSAGK